MRSVRSQPSRKETPLPVEFLDWQVALRRWTMQERHGSPHVGVAPLLCVRQPGLALGVSVHPIICGILPRVDRLEEKTKEFRALYEGGIEEGARVVYDRGIEYLRSYYQTADDFDPSSLTTLLPRDLPVVLALRAEPRCSLVFYVFDLRDRSDVGRFRSVQIDARAEVLESGPVFDNVWWHNTLFHGPADDCVVIRFGHERSYDTRFGQLASLRETTR